MWLVLQQDEPSDYVVATGEQHSVREFVEKAFRCIGEEITYIKQINIHINIFTFFYIFIMLMTHTHTHTSQKGGRTKGSTKWG